MFEIHVWELRATFLRNHNMRRRKDPKRKTTQAQKTTQARKTAQVEDNSSSESAHIPGNHHNCQKHRGTTPDKGHYTRSGALHPLRGGAPVTWRCTRYVAAHPLRGAAPVTWRRTRTEEVHCLRIGCSAPTHKNKRGTGTPNHSPPHHSVRSRALLAARRPRRHLHSDPLRHPHSGPLRHLPHPYMRRASKRPGSRQRPRPLRL